MDNIARLWVSPLRQERANEVSEHPKKILQSKHSNLK